MNKYQEIIAVVDYFVGKASKVTGVKHSCEQLLFRAPVDSFFHEYVSKVPLKIDTCPNMRSPISFSVDTRPKLNVHETFI